MKKKYTIFVSSWYSRTVKITDSLSLNYTRYKERISSITFFFVIKNLIWGRWFTLNVYFITVYLLSNRWHRGGYTSMNKTKCKLSFITRDGKNNEVIKYYIIYEMELNLMRLKWFSPSGKIQFNIRKIAKNLILFELQLNELFSTILVSMYQREFEKLSSVSQGYLKFN